MATQAHPYPVQSLLGRAAAVTRSRSAQYFAGVLALAAAYYGAAKLGQSLRYTASVSAIWPPAGVGIAALYLWGLRWWPGVFIAELAVNGELLVGENALPLGSLIGQQAGNMAEIVVGARLLHRLIGSRAALDRADQIGGMLAALGIATAISATVGTASMLLGGVIQESEALSFWRTWWLGDTAGALVVVPLALAWVPGPAAAWRRIYAWQGALMIAVVVGFSVLAFSIKGPVAYMVFPALIWAAFRFGPAGATLSVAIAAGIAIGFTAHEAGPFSTQPIDLRTLSTQLYIGVAAVTTLLLSALVIERAAPGTFDFMPAAGLRNRSYHVPAGERPLLVYDPALSTASEVVAEGIGAALRARFSTESAIVVALESQTVVTHFVIPDVRTATADDLELAHIAGRHWVSVAFGRGNVVLISEYLTQVMDPLDLTGAGLPIDRFKVFAIKSRVHFRRGFDDSGFAKTILLVEPEQPFLGTVRLDALPYPNVDISKFYPYGDPRPLA